MTKKNNRVILSLAFSSLILTALACKAVQVGVVTSTTESSVQPVADQSESSPTDLPEQENPPDLEGPAVITAVAWQGHIASMPEGSQYDDMVILNPEGTGEYGLVGATPEIEAEIRSLRDGEAAQNYVHLWGSFTCGIDDVNDCQLLVDRLQYGAQMTEEEISNWNGTIKGFDFNMGPVYGFILDAEIPAAYGIYSSQDPSLQAEIECLRDTGTLVQVSGKLLVGFPDVNSTRIEVTSLQILEEGSQTQPAQESFDPTADWEVYTSSRYDYQIKYPGIAELSYYGPEGFSQDDLPEGMTPEDYMDALLKEYTDQLCVQIEIGLGFIFISAPPNNQGELLVHCGVPAWGAGETISLERNVTIGDLVYQAGGVEFISSSPVGETLDLHMEILFIDLEDGTRIAYGSTPRADATYQDYLMKTRDSLERIIGTYQDLD